MRFLNAPHKYSGEMHVLAHQRNNDEGQVDEEEDEDDRGSDSYPSPLLMTVIEQLSIKVANGSLSPSDVLAIVSYVRKLLCGLSSEVRQLQLLQLVAGKVDEALNLDRLFPQYESMTAAIRREVDMLQFHMKCPRASDISTLHGSEAAIDNFFIRIEQLLNRECLHIRATCPPC